MDSVKDLLDLREDNILVARWSWGSHRSAVIGLVIVTFMTLLLCLPFIRALYWVGDEGILLRGATELASGKKIYTDFFAFYPPAGYLIVKTWIEIFGPGFLGVRFFAVLMIVGIAGFSYLACLLVSGNVILSAFLALAWVTTSKTTWIVGINHHWLTTLLTMAAFCLALQGIGNRQNNSRIALPIFAGLVAGTAAMVTSSCGLWATLATAASFMDVRRFRGQLVACLLGCLVAPLLCLAYILLNGEFVPAYDQIVGFTLTQYSTIQKVPFGNGLRWFYPNQYLFPLAGILALVALVKNRRGHFHDPQFRSCILYALAGLAGAYPRPDVVHIDFTAPLALPLLAYCVSWFTKSWRSFYRPVAFGLAVLWCLPPSVGFVHRGLAAMHAPVVASAMGPVALMGEENNGGEALFRFLASTSPHDNILFYPYMPLLPYLGQRQQASRYDVFTPDYTTPAQYFEACQDATRQAKWVVFDVPRMDAKNWLISFPAMKDPAPPETRAFEHAITQNFVFVTRMGIFEIRQRTAATNAAECSKILQ